MGSGRRHASALGLIGQTPVVRINRARNPGMATLWAKLEGANPSHASRDRLAAHLVRRAVDSGRLSPAQSVLVEATAGRTGLSLGMVCAIRGVHLVLVLPRGAAPDAWLQQLSMIGAECVLTPAEDGMIGARREAERIAAETPNAMFLDQFHNPYNPETYRDTLAQELVEDFADIGLHGFVAGVGTGGTLSGTAPVLRRRWPHIRIWAVEPASSAVLSGGAPGRHHIPGMGAGFVPPLLDSAAYDHVEPVADQHAQDAARALARAEGLLVDVASGAIFIAARKLAAQLGPDHHVAFLCPATIT